MEEAWIDCVHRSEQCRHLDHTRTSHPLWRRRSCETIWTWKRIVTTSCLSISYRCGRSRLHYQPKGETCHWQLQHNLTQNLTSTTLIWWPTEDHHVFYLQPYLFIRPQGGRLFLPLPVWCHCSNSQASRCWYVATLMPLLHPAMLDQNIAHDKGWIAIEICYEIWQMGQIWWL